MRKIAVFTGTRAEYGLLYWLLRDIKSDPALKLQLLVSGMHLSPEFGNTYIEIEKDGFVIDEKVEMLLSSDTAIGVAKSIGLGVLGLTDALNRLKPDALVILGDRFEALAAAQTAMILRIPIVHLHGGEITEGAYDDSIRHAITKLSHYHCTSTSAYRKRVIQLGEDPARVLNVGAIGLDNVLRGELLTLQELSASLKFELRKPFLLLTYHPVTIGDEDPEDTFKAILRAIDTQPDHQVIITYPNADDGGRKIIPLLEAYAMQQPNRVLAIPSLGHKRFMSAVKHSAAVIGNSSSGIIEVPAFRVPTVNVGVRQQGRLAANSVVDCSIDENSIKNAISQAVSTNYEQSKVAIENPYGQGDASGQIINLLKHAQLNLAKTFYDIKTE